MTAMISRLILVATLCFAPVALAHHSLNAEFDVDRQATWKGVVLQVDWSNPHVYILLSVKDAAGNVEVWKLQGNQPHMLQADGVRRDTVKPGTTITVTGFPPKLAGPNAPHSGFAREIELPDGLKRTFGSLTWMRQN
jgi:hypothetical protein